MVRPFGCHYWKWRVHLNRDMEDTIKKSQPLPRGLVSGRDRDTKQAHPPYKLVFCKITNIPPRGARCLPGVMLTQLFKHSVISNISASTTNTIPTHPLIYVLCEVCMT